MVFYEDGATPWMRHMAHDIICLLDLVYPGWSWAVNVYGDEKGGGYHIRLLDFPSNYGFNNPKAHLFGSASEMRASIIRHAGELLERCGVRRGKMEDDQPLIGRMEGVPEKFQFEPDPEKLPKVNLETVIATAEREMRDQPRPQIITEAK